MATTLDAPLGNPNRSKFLLGGLLILGAVAYMIYASTLGGAQFFYTVDEAYQGGESVINTPIRISGAVLGETIQYDPETLTLRFTVVHMPADNNIIDEEGGLAAALIAAVNDPTRARMQIEYIGVQPDLLQHEAQAIMTGRLSDDGVFYAEELLLKCPTRYEETIPGQING